VYHWEVILIGCDQDVIPHVRHALMCNAATIEAECRDVGATMEVLESSNTKKRALVLHLKPFESLDELRRLCRAFPNWPVMVLMDAGSEGPMQLNSAFVSIMKLGAWQIVGLPLDAGAFKTALDRLVEQPVHSSPFIRKSSPLPASREGAGRRRWR